MVDAFLAHHFAVNPMIDLNSLEFVLPCTEKLFEASNSRRWGVELSHGSMLTTPSITVNTQSSALPLPIETFGMYGILSTAWAKVSEASSRLLYRHTRVEGYKAIAPLTVYNRDTEAKEIAPFLMKVHAVYRDVFATINPNCLVSWNNICMNLVSNPYMFEQAIGRQGAERARAALNEIAIWTRTSYARRACVHAAQTYLLMSRRKTSDGIMFHSETALFASALVLGLYLYLVPNPKNLSQVTADIETFELLDEVEWSIVGSAGLSEHETEILSPADSIENNVYDVKRFIQSGGVVSFNGEVRLGGFSSARRIFLEYLSLMEDVGKWNTRMYCRILRVISNMTLEPGSIEGLGNDFVTKG